MAHNEAGACAAPVSVICPYPPHTTATLTSQTHQLHQTSYLNSIRHISLPPSPHLYIQPRASDLLPHSSDHQTSLLPSLATTQSSRPIIPPPCSPHLMSTSSHVQQTSTTQSSQPIIPPPCPPHLAPTSSHVHHTSLPPSPETLSSVNPSSHSLLPLPYLCIQPCPPDLHHSLQSTHHPTSLPPLPDHLILLGTWQKDGVAATLVPVELHALLVVYERQLPLVIDKHVLCMAVAL